MNPFFGTQTILQDSQLLFRRSKLFVMHLVRCTKPQCCSKVQNNYPIGIVVWLSCKVSDGGPVMRNDLSEVEPSMYTERFCATVLGEFEKVEVIGVWLVGCFLHSFFRGLGFCKDHSLRSRYRMRGEALTRRFLELFSCSAS